MITILNWSFGALGILLAALVFPGISITGFWSALAAAFIFGVCNMALRPLLLALTLPLDVITCGAFCTIMNAFLILIAYLGLTEFYLGSFLIVIPLSIMLALVTYFAAKKEFAARIASVYLSYKKVLTECVRFPEGLVGWTTPNLQIPEKRLQDIRTG